MLFVYMELHSFFYIVVEEKVCDYLENMRLLRKFEIVDFLGATLSRLDLEFNTYFKNHMSKLWDGKYIDLGKHKELQLKSS